MPPWTDPSWQAEAHAWIQAELERLGAGVAGPIEQPHIVPWSTVMRVPTGDGAVYFKANAPELSHEAAVTTLLARLRPDCVPRLLAVELERGWMLMADAGTRLREVIEHERDLGPWLEVLPLYAGVQLDLAGHAEELLALGTPDLRLATLAAKYERLIDELEGLAPEERRRLQGLVPHVVELCDELAAYGVPETIQHDDFHDGQVYVRDGRYLLLDWGDACVSHPFFTLSVTLEGVLAWGLDDVEGSVDTTPFLNAYLAAFADYGDRSALEAAARMALRLGWVCRAVNARLGNPEDAHTSALLRMFLDGRT
jgi:hypothetical protein